ncbi:MAG: competence/damage-inducible protein A [Actinobacteria bacterium]|nr:competence/damage-inducible protein A [Actinomycetota bacterium]MDQ3532474.1 competence/damage-inducible protein A [Actinomycetota bacterium]
MNAEIIGVGTELLLGQIADTNAQHISTALAEIGVDVHRHTAVGDNPKRMTLVIKEALARCDAVIITGGLGPTPDDITREGVAAALGLELRRDPELVALIRAIFKIRNRAMPESNLRQADLPAGARAIAPEGTAPGFTLDGPTGVIFALPGVPWEMKAMLEKAVLPELTVRSGAAAIVSRQILVLGLGESLTHEKIADLVDAQTNPTIAYLAGKGQVRVRVTAKAGSQANAAALIDPVEEAIRARLGPAAVPGDHDSLTTALPAMLLARAATVAAAESLTGGLIGVELTRGPGASEFFRGSLVCYSDEAKRDVAGVPQSVLDRSGAVSEQTAAALAEGAASRLGADLGVAATGVAGPGEQGGQPVGTVFVGACWGGRTVARRAFTYGDRDNIRALAVTAALDLGRRMIEGTA